MKLIHWAALALLAGCAAPVVDAPIPPGFAQWGAGSGSLPPEFAWDYQVTFSDDQMVWVRYCKGYANTAPGCATASSALSETEYSALISALTPLADELAARPPQASSEISVGGGSLSGQLVRDGITIRLPNTSIDADAARVAAVLDLLRQYTPQSLIEEASSRARLPR
jgi:hypothetical protein